MSGEQMGLFGGGESAMVAHGGGARGDGPSLVEPVKTDPRLAAVAERLPACAYFGTSSWSFPGWNGIVWDGDYSASELSRGGLSAYGRHPLLRTVGVDRTYYAPMGAGDLAAYAEQTPEGFRFLVKAHESLMAPTVEVNGRVEANPVFLDPAYAAERVIGPVRQGLGAKAGPVLFQFSPMDLRVIGGEAAFIDRIGAFLLALPTAGRDDAPNMRYAVEVRNAEAFTPGLVDAVTSAGGVVCLSVHPALPTIAEQARIASEVAAFSAEGTPLLVRWMLHAGLSYTAAQQRYHPFNAVIDGDVPTRAAIASLVADAVRANRPAYVIVNNKAEGSSPLSVARLAATVADLA